MSRRQYTKPITPVKHSLDLLDNDKNHIILSKYDYSQIKIEWYCFPPTQDESLETNDDDSDVLKENLDPIVKRTTIEHYPGSLESLNIKFVKNFTISGVDGIEISIDDKSIYILKERVITGKIREASYSDKIDVILYGLENNRHVAVAGPVGGVTGIDNDTEVKDIEFVGVLARPQDYPHGISLKIKGDLVEITNRGEYKERTLETDESDLCKLLDYKIDNLIDVRYIDGPVDRLLKLLKLAKLMKILQDPLQGAGTLNLLETINNLKEQVKKYKVKTNKLETDLQEKKETVKTSQNELEQALKRIKVLELEQHTFKQAIKNDILEILNKN